MTAVEKYFKYLHLASVIDYYFRQQAQKTCFAMFPYVVIKQHLKCFWSVGLYVRPIIMSDMSGAQCENL